MSIRLETALRTGIANTQNAEIAAHEMNWSVDIPLKYPAVKERTPPNPRYNCHGLTFGSRRTRIIATASIVQTILHDDSLLEVPHYQVLPGDIVLYFPEDESEANHSGIVVALSDDGGELLVCSKWGSAGEYIHQLSDCPSVYGPKKKFYRCMP